MKPMLCIYEPKSSYPRANRSTEWKKVMRQIWEESQQKGIVHSDDDETYFSGDGLYLQKDGRCFNIRRIGTGIYIRPVSWCFWKWSLHS